MTRVDESGVQREAKRAWSVVAVYEDPAARERAVGFCDQLVGRFWARFEFDVSWWSFALLEQAAASKAAAEQAARADLVVISTTPAGDLPMPVKTWLEAWLRQRGEREGMLVGLMEPSASPGAPEGLKHYCLRNAAHRGAMDYLTQLPQDISHPIPDSLDSYTSRAEQVTSLLDDILHQQAPPTQPADLSWFESECPTWQLPAPRRRLLAAR